PGAAPEGRTLLSLVRHGVAVCPPHTAFDNTRGGINELLAARLGLTDLTPLRRRDEARQCKVVVFVPDKDLGRVSDALFAAGAGGVGGHSGRGVPLARAPGLFCARPAHPTPAGKGRAGGG